VIRFVFSIFNFIFYFIKLYLFFYSNDYKEPMIETTTISNNDIVKTNFTYHNSHSFCLFLIIHIHILFISYFIQTTSSPPTNQTALIALIILGSIAGLVCLLMICAYIRKQTMKTKNTNAP